MKKVTYSIAVALCCGLLTSCGFGTTGTATTDNSQQTVGAGDILGAILTNSAGGSTAASTGNVLGDIISVFAGDILTNKKDDMYKFTVYKNLEAKYKFVISSTVVKHPPYMVTEGLITYAYDMCEVLFISSEYKFHESTSSWKLVKPSIITQNIFSYSDIKDDKVVKDSDFDIISARLTDITPSTPEIDYIIRQIMINQIKNAIL